MENQSIKINSNNTTTTAQSTASQNLQHNHSLSGQQPQSSSSSSTIDAVATVDSQQHQQQQSGGPGRPSSTLNHQQQYTPGQQRWQAEVMPPGSSSAGPMPGMMHSSPHFPIPPQQQYVHQQHLGVPSPSHYGYGSQQPPQQHSPNSNRPYPPSQMLHPAMMYPLPHGYGPPMVPQGTSIYGHPSSQQYWASRSVNGPIGGGQQLPGMMGPSAPQTPSHYPSQSQQTGQPTSNEMPSTSQHTPQSSQQQQIPAPSPSGAINSSHDETMDENAGHRPRSSQSLHQQQHQFATPQGQPQQPPPQQIPLQLPPHPHFQQQQQIRYSPAAMLPPHGAPPQMAPGQFQPAPIVGGTHPGSSMQPQMQHMSMAQMQMHPHHPTGSFPIHPGMYFTPPPSNHSAAPMHQQAPPPPSILSGLKPAQREAVEKLVGQLANPKQQQQMSPEMVYERRLFYERLVLLNEQQGEVLSGPPQVSKSMVDLHALYKAVKQKGGFEKTIRDKIWKNLCTDANIDMQQSSAAGFQLRKHYQKYLLKLECLEQNLNAQDLIEFAEKQKKKKKEKESKDAPSIPAASLSAATSSTAAAAGPSTPSTSTATSNISTIAGGKEDVQPRPPNYPAIQLMNGPPPSQQQPFAGYPPHGMQLPPGIAYPGPEFVGPPPTSGGYPMPGPQFGQYPPSAWAYQQQQQMQTGMSTGGQKTSQLMRPPQPHTGQQLADDEQQQQYHQQRLGSSSRLSAASTPVSATEHQSRASSVAGNAQEKHEPKDEEQRGGDVGGQNQHQPRQTQTPSSSFSANAPTPPLTTSATPLPGPIGITQSPSTTQISQQQMTPAATGYYHPAAPYNRYPPLASGQSGEMYGAGPAPGIYGTPQQPPHWGYGMPPQTRYHPPPPGAPTSRYPQYAVQSAIQQPQLQSAASNSPQQQSSTSGQQQPVRGTPITNTPKAGSVYTPYGAGGQSSSMRTAGSATTGMLPMPTVPMPPYSNQQSIPPQQFHAWFGSATMSTQPPPFPPQSLEAQTIAQIQQQQSTQMQQRFRRPKIYSRDLYGATPARIVMALRSSLHLETCWALNALNIQLYDDTTIPTMHPLSLAQTPELLNLIVEHFAAVLSLIFPRHFSTDIIDWGWGRLSSIPSETKSKSSNQPDKPPKQEPIEHHIENNIKETIGLMVRPPQSSTTNSEYLPKPMSNFTMISRLGRRVKLDQVEMPPELAAEVMEICKGENQLGESEKQADDENKNDIPKFTCRIRRQIIQQIQTKREMEKCEVFKKMNEEDFYKTDFWEEEETHIMEEHKPEIKEKENGSHRQLKFWQRQDRHGMDECELVSRSTVLQNEHSDELMEQVVDRCLALSNILRGFSFLPGQERLLAQHTGLLRLLPALLMLMVDEANQNNEAKKFKFPRPSSTNENQSEEGKMQWDGQAMPTRQIIPPEHDSRKKWLLEVANQLRDDAFTILAHVSPNLDLFDTDSTLSWAIFNSLIHWTVSTDLQTRDPLPPYGAIPPRHYALEIICKMSVLERNVDLLVSTGPWPRIEEFVRLLCSFVCEEPPVREFAIVILNAICGASESICNIVAIETDLLEYLITFLEAADANMTQIALHQGIHTLRENPEIIGTSVGMLRRAALILVQIVKQQNCRPCFQRFQHRLLQFTVSHYMDSRVAAMVADILFEMQQDSTPRKGEINNGGDTFGEEQPMKESMDKMMESNNGHGKLSSSAVFQPPAKMEPELMFNGDENVEGMAITGTNGNNNVIDASFCSTTTSSMIDSPSIENNNNNHQNKAMNRKRPKKRRSVTSDSSESSSMLSENIGINHIDMDNGGDAHCNWNGHSAINHSGETIFESDAIEKKKSKKQMASSIGGTVNEIVREKMRNNILGKAAANHKKKNGWIDSGAMLNGIAAENCIDGHHNEMEMEQTEQPTTTTSKMAEPTSPTTNSTTSITTSTPAQTLAVSTGANNANNNKNAAQSGSLTAVA